MSVSGERSGGVVVVVRAVGRGVRVSGIAGGGRGDGVACGWGVGVVCLGGWGGVVWEEWMRGGQEEWMVGGVDTDTQILPVCFIRTACSQCQKKTKAHWN